MHIPGYTVCTYPFYCEIILSQVPEVNTGRTDYSKQSKSTCPTVIIYAYKKPKYANDLWFMQDVKGSRTQGQVSDGKTKALETEKLYKTIT